MESDQMKEITEKLEQGVKDLLLIAFKKSDATPAMGNNSWQKNFGKQVFELADAKLHSINLTASNGEQPPRVDLRTRKVEAESVAYTVCQHYGLDTSDYSLGYVTSGKELAGVTNSLETIRKTAAEIIKTIDGHIAEIQKTQESKKEVHTLTPTVGEKESTEKNSITEKLEKCKTEAVSRNQSNEKTAPSKNKELER